MVPRKLLAIFMVMFQFFQSYWDWLPVEIQDHIVSLATRQHVRDRRKRLWELHEDIIYCHRLKTAWRGKIETKWIRCRSPYCIQQSLNGKPIHIMIYAHYQNPITHENKKIALGDKFKEAFGDLIDRYFHQRSCDFHHMF